MESTGERAFLTAACEARGCRESSAVRLTIYRAGVPDWVHVCRAHARLLQESGATTPPPSTRLKESPMPSNRIATCAACGEERLIKSKGLCSRCYNLDLARRTDTPASPAVADEAEALRARVAELEERLAVAERENGELARQRDEALAKAATATDRRPLTPEVVREACRLLDAAADCERDAKETERRAEALANDARETRERAAQLRARALAFDFTDDRDDTAAA